MRATVIAVTACLLVAIGATPSLARHVHRHHFHHGYERGFGPYLHSRECAPRYDSSGAAVGCL